MVSKREKQLQWYQSKQRVRRDPPRESDDELVQMQGEIKYERGYVKKLDPNVTPESGFKIQSRFWGYQSGRRSNKGFTKSLLFRHSVVAVVAKADIFPPNLTQL